jgi:small subunit ribosomal protein S8
MSMTDPISDLLTRIRNAQGARHFQVAVPASRIKTRITEILKEEGFITDYVLVDKKPQSDLLITLKYSHDHSGAIAGLQRESRPGRRKYVGAGDIPQILDGLGLAILSTSKGVMPGYLARKENVGGEHLCSIW